MFLRFEENPNTGFVDDRVYQERSEPQIVTHILRRRDGHDQWCPVTGLRPGAVSVPALAIKVEDSGEGICYLVYGDRWGLRLKDPGCSDPWSLDDPHQWGEPFLLLPADGADLRLS
jgi:hypothetical protein